MESTSVTSYISVMQVAHNAYDIQLTCNWAASVGINLWQVSMRPRETFATYSVFLSMSTTYLQIARDLTSI